MRQLHFYYQDDDLIVVEKPAGVLVHPSEHAISTGRAIKNLDLIRIARNQIDKKVYPVHRLDRSTSGIIILALKPEIAHSLQKQFQERRIQKKYLAIVRGWCPAQGVIDTPLLTRLDGGKMGEAKTIFETLHTFELPYPTQNFETSRFSVVLIQPETGRLHQIRRHFKHIFHPIIGDTVHGDGKQNALWRKLTSDRRLYLKACALDFNHPVTNEKIKIDALWSPAWKRAFEISKIKKAHLRLR